MNSKSTPPQTLASPPLSTLASANFDRASARYHSAFTASKNPIHPPLVPAESFFNHSLPSLHRCPLCTFVPSSSSPLSAHLAAAHPSAHRLPPLKTSSGNNDGPLPSLHSLTTVRNAHLYCHVCNVACETEAQHDAHEKGQKHRKNVAMQKAWSAVSGVLEKEGIVFVSEGLWFCMHCQTCLDSKMTVMQHLQSVKHKKVYEEVRTGKRKVREYSLEMIEANQQKEESGSKRGRVPQFVCDVCNIKCNSQDNLDMHFASIKHKKKIALVATPTSVISTAGSTITPSVKQASDHYCNVCNVTCSGSENFAAHLRGKPHAKKLRASAGVKSIESTKSPISEADGRTDL